MNNSEEIGVKIMEMPMLECLIEPKPNYRLSKMKDHEAEELYKKKKEKMAIMLNIMNDQEVNIMNKENVYRPNKDHNNIHDSDVNKVQSENDLKESKTDSIKEVKSSITRNDTEPNLLNINVDRKKLMNIKNIKPTNGILVIKNKVKLVNKHYKLNLKIINPKKSENRVTTKKRPGTIIKNPKVKIKNEAEQFNDIITQLRKYFVNS